MGRLHGLTCFCSKVLGGLSGGGSGNGEHLLEAEAALEQAGMPEAVAPVKIYAQTRARSQDMPCTSESEPLRHYASKQTS